MEVLEFFEVPPYLICVIRSYLSDRWYTGKDEEGRRPVERGVLQDSVLGPILWIISYDAMFRCFMPPDTGMASNTDDTLFLAGACWWHETLRHDKLIVACAVCAIRGLGLKVSTAKSEAIWYYDKWRRGAPLPDLCLDINREDIEVGLQMKYLGPLLTHFRLLVPKQTAAANALCGFLPNIGGAGIGVCRLYVRVVRFWVLYGAPVWAKELMASRRSLLLLRRLHRTTAITIIRGYRTVSYVSTAPAPGLGAPRGVRKPERPGLGRGLHPAG